MNHPPIRAHNVFFLAGAALLAAAVLAACQPGADEPWSDTELAAIRALWIGSLKPLPADPSNAYADDPRAAALGQALFFDTRLSGNGEVACATCHVPELMFQDGTALAQGVGTTNRRTMTIVGAAYSPWLFWDGRKDSLWSQALGPLESPVEHGGNRTFYAHLIDEHYREAYEALFGAMPAVSHLPLNAGPAANPEARAAWDAMAPEDRAAVTRLFTNLGKAIAAYERQLLPGPARFDAYAEALLAGEVERAAAILTPDEVVGLRLFIGEAHCLNCHNGPLFTNNDFHNTGVPAAPGLPADSGRALGAQQVQADEFNCLSAYSDAVPSDCGELTYMTADGHDLAGQFKPPSLRNVVGRGPYMHAGQFATLEEVLHHYNTAPAAPVGQSELEALNLSEQEMGQIIAFLHTLSGPIEADPHWLHAPGATP